MRRLSGTTVGSALPVVDRCAHTRLFRSEVMIRRLLPFGAAGLFLTGCAVEPGPSQCTSVQGYLYHDSNHPDGFSPSSPPPHYDSSHGTWHRPPAVSDKPN
jgi:hypothetical protein